MAIKNLRNQIFDNFGDNYGVDPYDDYGMDSYGNTSGFGGYDESFEYSPVTSRQDAYPPPMQSQSPDMSTFQNMPLQVPTYGPQGSKGTEPRSDFLKMLEEAYTPETRATNRFNELLDQFPDRKPPSFARALVAGGLSLGSQDPIGTSQKVMYAPYLRDVAEWKEKTGPFGNAAQYENTANINERTLAGNLITAQVNQQRYDQQNAVAQEKNRIAEIVAIARDFAARNPKLEIKAPPGGHLIGIDPLTGESRPILDRQGNPIPSGTMTQYELENLRANSRIEASRVQGENAARNIISAGGGIWKDEAGNLYTVNPRGVTPGATSGALPAPGAVTPVGNAPPNPTGKLTPTTGAGGGSNDPNELEISRAQTRRTKEAFLQLPGASDHIIQSGDTFTLKPRPRDPEQLKRWQIVADYIVTGKPPAEPIPPMPPSSGIPSWFGGWGGFGKIGQNTASLPQAPTGANPPPPPAAGQSGTSVSGRNVESGLGAVPPQGAEPQPIIQPSRSNPNIVRGSMDGGKTWLYSTDGGKTWSATPPRR